MNKRSSEITMVSAVNEGCAANLTLLRVCEEQTKLYIKL